MESASDVAKGVLLLAVLTIASSYLDDAEGEAAGSPDTLQFFFGNDTWRIRTYAMDHDIHVHKIGGAFSIEAAEANIRSFYAEVIGTVHRLEFDDVGDAAAVDAVLKRNDLAGALESNTAGITFYNPDGGEYRTKSEPK